MSAAKAQTVNKFHCKVNRRADNHHQHAKTRSEYPLPIFRYDIDFQKIKCYLGLNLIFIGIFLVPNLDYSIFNGILSVP